MYVDIELSTLPIAISVTDYIKVVLSLRLLFWRHNLGSMWPIDISITHLIDVQDFLSASFMSLYFRRMCLIAIKSTLTFLCHWFA